VLREETVERALVEIARGNAEYMYFFDHLNSAAWLEPLARHGRFQKPPDPVRREQYISFPAWPESRYLARMSAVRGAQVAVLEIVLRIPATENASVHDDLMNVALNLQPDQAARLVPRVCAWVRGPVKLQMPYKIGDLINRLAEGGEQQAALALAGAALAFGPDPQVTSEDGEAQRDRQPRPRFQDFHYGAIVTNVLPVLARATGLAAVHLFADVLDEWISLSRDESEVSDEDYLSHRQPAIEDPTNAHDLPSVLIGAARDAVELVVRDDASRFAEVVTILRGKRWVTFRRIELHLGRTFPEQGKGIAEEFFQEPERLDWRGLSHEAVLLLRDSFSVLSGATKQTVLSWIERGPQREGVLRWLGSFPEPVTEEAVRALSDQWRRDRFAILTGQLPAPYDTILTDLVAQYGEARALEKTNQVTGGPIGPRSPKTVEELNGMGVAAIMSYLASWTPGANIFSETAEGLGRNLAAVVAQRPNDFADAAEGFKRLDPTYVRSFLVGLTAALKERKVFDWRPVLGLAVWVVGRPREIPGRKGDLMITDPDWGWSRDAVIDLITAGLEDGPGSLACGDRPMVWQAIRPLADDPNPSSQDETGPHFDPAHLSINSTRGRAFYLIVKYAWWVRRCAEAGGQVPTTFDVMPEVREILDAHLDTRVDPTLMIRTVYGESIRSFAGLDWEWLRANLGRIFSDAEGDTLRFIAAWESFVTFAQPHPLLLSLLMPFYRRAVSRIGEPGLLRHPVSPEQRLSEHLMVFYWWGKIGLETDDGLLDAFYARASAPLRAHALWFIKNILANPGDAQPVAFERLQRLIERRLAAANTATLPAEFAEELAMFGYWFVSGRFEERWALQTLISTLTLAKKAHDERGILQRLVELCPRHSVECIECLRLVIEGDQERLLMVLAEEKAREVLRIGLASKQPQAALAARRLIQDLIALGYFEFRTLLR
jgi:hypothetical protein